MQARRFAWLIPLLLFPAGCLSTWRQADRDISELSALVDAVDTHQVVDTLPALRSPAGGPTGPPPAVMPLPQPAAAPLSQRVSLSPVAFAQPEVPPAPRMVDQQVPGPRFTLKIPPELPGAEAPPIDLGKMTPEQRRQYVRQLYPEIPPLPPERPLALGPEGRPISLADLQRLGETYSPTIKSAVAAVEAAKGAAKQAGAYPNPTFAYEHDTVETGPAGYPGFFIDQVIKTGGKLTVAVAAATMDVLNAKLALRRARSDVRYAIRGNYFAVLVARENIKVSDALYRFTEEIYRVQVDLLDKGFAAPYEPMQLRPLVLQAQLNLIQARNQYEASWRQLSANLGLPDMPPSELDGRVDMPVPVFEYNDVLARLGNHTDVLTALVSLQKAKYNLQAAKLVPLPDVDVRALVQKDYTTPPNQIAHSVSVTIPIPIWDQNKGGIHQAEMLLAQASVGPDQARNALINTLADAYYRYLTARRTVSISLQQVRDQVRAYRGLYARRQSLPGDVAFADVVTGQQTLATYIGNYITALGAQWQAVVDVANLLQTDDLFQGGPQEGMEPVPDLRFLPPLPKHMPREHAKPGNGTGTAADCAAVPGAATPEAPPPPAGPSLPAPPAPGGR